MAMKRWKELVQVEPHVLAGGCAHVSSPLQKSGLGCGQQEDLQKPYLAAAHGACCPLRTSAGYGVPIT
jgi:hypothetical protein